MLGSKNLGLRTGLGSKYLSIGTMGNKFSLQSRTGTPAGRMDMNPNIHNDFNSNLVSRQPMRNLVRINS